LKEGDLRAATIPLGKDEKSVGTQNTIPACQPEGGLMLPIYIQQNRQGLSAGDERMYLFEKIGAGCAKQS
jgi:hypothetical protein